MVRRPAPVDGSALVLGFAVQYILYNYLTIGPMSVASVSPGQRRAAVSFPSLSIFLYSRGSLRQAPQPLPARVPPAANGIS